jgi:3-oxoacyl-[acyl-carrier-protein] synthase-3
METISITGMGSYLPRLMHTDETLPALEKPLTAEEQAKIGVHRRGWAGDGEGIAEMAAHAARRALGRAEVDPASLDFLILANWTQRRYIPEFAPKLQALIGAPRAFGFDVSCACAGFVYGVGIAQGFLQNPRFRRGLVVASETTSVRGRPRSKSTVIFGDGAGAFVLEKDAGRGGEVLDLELTTDGTHHHIMEVNEEGWVRTHIAQRELNELAARTFLDASSRVLERAGMTIGDVDWVVPHSGTAGVQATLIKVLGVDPERVLTNFPIVGNLSSAAIPVSLDHFVREGKIRPGQTILSPTTGTGWYGAAMLYRV